MSAIPVKIIDTMHELEHEYKSLTNVPRKDTRLIKLNRFFNNDEDAKDDKIKSLIIDGYSVREIEDMVKTSHERVSRVAIQYHIPIRQKFNYVAVKKNSPRIFSFSLAGFKVVTKSDTSNFKNAKQALKRKGYKLRVPQKPVRWSSVMPGDNYIDGKDICVKE